MSTTITPSVELDELGKFFTIAARRIDAGQAAPEMFSAAVDAAWHRLVADPAAHEAPPAASTAGPGTSPHG
ncbi:hypothetical protein [Kitasatospora sp. SUK 42]|uniref:hypothetical protein n=1 Tax=Kitasatospora sp. SUK 42 TaxID=1588882 RepID=UPI0018C96713|nr:hypothetical protein [Kitasatospora sp. SUK 42]MBV2155058.1 hypothetical protein [Kitasatospora sp. SUK 42]